MSTRKRSVTKAEVIDTSVIEAVVQEEFPNQVISQYKINKKTKLGCERTVWMRPKSPCSKDAGSVNVSISWPEGQLGHGRVNVSGGTTYVCWVDDGKVCVAPWTKPPSIFGYWEKYGVEWPGNNKKMDTVAILIMVAVGMVLYVLLSGFLSFFVDGMFNWRDDISPIRTLLPSVMFGVSAVIATLYAAIMIRMVLSGNIARAWSQEIAFIEHSRDGDQSSENTTATSTETAAE